MKRWILGTTAALALASAAAAQQTDLTIALQLEPPHLDPDQRRRRRHRLGALCQRLRGADPLHARRHRSSRRSPKAGTSATTALTYTFHLHDGVTFHDGTAMDAEDVKFSLDRARAEDSANAQKPLFAGHRGGRR